MRVYWCVSVLYGGFIVRITTPVAAIVLAVVMLCGNCGAQQSEPNGNGDSNDLSAYYGFGEIEIIKLDRMIKCLRIADFNGDGRSDIAVVNNRKARIELLIQKERLGPGQAEVTVRDEDADINLITPPTRFERQEIAVSQKIYSMDTGDFNSDGLTDLAFYGDPKGLYVILQKAAEKNVSTKPGKLSWHRRKKIDIQDAVLTFHSLKCGDLNNDGADDLVLAGRDVIYFIKQKPDASLAEAVKYPTTAQTLGLRTADLNGDALNDLIIITNDRQKPLHVRFGLKTGSLGPQIAFFVEKPYWLKLYNIDSAPGDELLAIDHRSGRLVCYKLISDSTRQDDWPILFYPLASGQAANLRDMVIADVDGNGLADVIISEPQSAELILYTQTAKAGLGEPVRFPAFSDIDSLSVAELDGDGRAELAVLSVKEKVIGISRLEDERLTFPRPIEVVGEPLAMELAEFDGDGNCDCVYVAKDTNDTRFLRVVYDLPSVWKKTRRAEIPLPRKADSKRKKRKSKHTAGLKLEKLTANPDALKVFDADGDGLADVLIFVRYEQPIFVHQKKAGQLETVDSASAQSSLIKQAALRSITIADVDGEEGAELLIAQRNFARSLVFSGGQVWQVIDQYNAKSTENNITAVAAFDMDAQNAETAPAILLLDGQKGQLQMLEKGPDKTYRFARQIDVGKWSTAKHTKMGYAALTGADDKNIILFDGEKFAIIIRPETGKLNERLEQQFSYQTKIKDGSYGNLAAGDINNDGWADIVMVEYKRNHIEILALDAQNKPIAAMRFKIFEEKSYRGSKAKGKSTVEPRELTVADVTGDGKQDLVTIIHDRVIIYPQD